MRAAEIMTRSVVTVHADTPVHRAAALMTEHGITSLPVLDEDDGVIGIVSEADLLRDRMPHDPRSHLRRDEPDQPDPARLVGQVMSEAVCCMGENADTADLAACMLDNNVRAVPIVDGRRLIGIVSRRDLLRTLLRDDTAITSEVIQRLDEYAPSPRRWRVDVEDGVVTIRGHVADTAEQEIVTVLARTVPGVTRVHLHPQS
jgi:CBS domain-containing protein